VRQRQKNCMRFYPLLTGELMSQQLLRGGMRAIAVRRGKMRTYCCCQVLLFIAVFLFEMCFEIKLIVTPLENTVIYKPNLPFKLFHCNIGNNKGNFPD